MAMAYPPTNPKELPSLGVQICWWALALSSPTGVVMGAIAYGSFRRARQRVTGGSYALAAIVVGCAASLVLPVGTRELTAQRRATRHRYGSSSCSSNIRQLGLAMTMYALDYDEAYPPCASWNALTMPYVRNKSIYRCPDEDVETVPSYGMNRNFNLLPMVKVAEPNHAVCLFDSIPGANREGGKELLPNPSRHDTGQNIEYADGHVEFISNTKIDAQQWTVKRDAKAKPEKLDRVP